MAHGDPLHKSPLLRERPDIALTDKERLSGADLLVKTLEALGVRHVFGYPGGAIMPVYDALVGSRLRHYLARHEQGAIHAAEGFARSTGALGVCMATSGPGATNLVTGLADAYLDSVPLLAITGQVASPLMGTDAFQEIDIFGITLPVVKHSYLIRSAVEIPSVFAEAVHIAMTGRPGPVLIDVPKDIAQTELDTPLHIDVSGQKHKGADARTIDEAIQRIENAKRPLVYAGGGIIMADALDAFRTFLKRTGLPHVATLKGLGSGELSDPNYLGMLGMHGTKAANLAVQQCDLLISVGARFDDRATGRVDDFAPKAKVIHLDVDAAEVHKIRRADVALTGCLETNLNALLANPPTMDNWLSELRENKAAFAPRYDAPGDGVYAPALLRQLSKMGGREMIIACDVGQHQMWVAQHCTFASPRQHLTSGGLGTMGYGLPAAIGAKVAHPEKPVVVVSGDGSIMMNIQELQTVHRYDLPVKIIVLDNQALGMVRQWQELFFEGNYSEVDLSDNPEFTELAKAFRLEGRKISCRGEVEEALQWLLDQERPALLHVEIDPKENVWPLVAPGSANDEMMEGNLAWQ